MYKNKNSLTVRSFKLEKGPLNLITDVAGVKVGHVTLEDTDVKTGVTAILPHQGNIFKHKVMAASHVMNGFGKSIGLVQIDELGTLETPIVLTNTLSVGEASQGLIHYMLDQNADIGRTAGSVNPVVCECNDGYLNDIRKMSVKPHHVIEAIEACSDVFEQGAVGAGKGMVCYGLKGGIGSASRQIAFEGKIYTLGMLVLTNFGRLETLVIDGNPVGDKIAKRIEQTKPDTEMSSLSRKPEQGSMIAVLATDVPLSDRQLKRLLKRIPAGMAHTGAYFGNGSGDIFIGFSTSNIVEHETTEAFVTMTTIHENQIDQLFQAVIETTEESILKSLLNAETTIGREGREKKSILEFESLL